MQQQLNQVESMLAPVKNEEERLAQITKTVLLDSVIQRTKTLATDAIKLSSEAQKAEAELKEMDKNNEVAKVASQIEKENQVRKNEIE